MILLLCRVHRTFRQQEVEPTTKVSKYEHMFSQKLDHFNGQNSTYFDQRYFLNDQFFSKSGPLVIMIGGEGEISEGDVLGGYSPFYFAKELNGLVVSLEHRFYGKSSPEFSLQDIRYLNSQQTIADYAQFIPYLKSQYNITKVLVIGGSYPGSLAAYLRTKLPHLVDGAFSSSGPIKAEFNYTQYLSHTQKQLENYDTNCPVKLQKAYQLAETLLNGSTTDLVTLSKLLDLSYPLLEVTHLDKQNILELLTDPVAGVIQYANPGDIKNFCEAVMGQNSSFAVIQYLVTLSPIDESTLYFDGFVKSLKMMNTSMRSWMWQTCSEFAYFQSADYEGSIFSKLINVDYFVQMCNDAFFKDLEISTEFEKSYEIIKEVTNTINNQVYGARNVPRDHIYYTNGEVDPWSELSMSGTLSWQDGQYRPKDTESELIVGGSHCSDLYMSWKQNDEVRSRQLAAVKAWFDME